MSTGNSSVAFVAKHDIPPSPPPASAVGPVKWVRENLFNGPVNSVLTVVFSVLVIWLVLSILPWFVDSSWHPAEMSLQGCRAEAEGACSRLSWNAGISLCSAFTTRPIFAPPSLSSWW